MNNQLKEEVYKCSKCGLCKSVCPIYLATKNEMFSPRGRHIILNNFLQNNKKPSNDFFKNLDVCLNCNLCKDFCPSNIDSGEIFRKLKKSSKIFYLNLFSRFFFHAILNNFKKKKPHKNISNKKVLYFEGCYNKFINASDRNHTIELIEQAGYKITQIVSECCGYIYLSNNDEKQYEQNKKKILKAFNKEAEYIICSCDSCYNTLSLMKEELSNKKLITLDKFLEINNIKIKQKENIKYFKAITRNDSPYLPQDIEIINEKGACSLMENFFAIKHPQLAKNIILKKDKYDKKLATTCNITLWGLIDNLKQEAIPYSKAIKKEVD